MNDEVPQPTQAERLAGLAEFLPIFEAEGFTFGEWEGGEGQMPWFALSTDAERFVQAAYQLHWVVPGFDWTTWSRTAEAQALMADPKALNVATVEDLEHLLTVHVRQDRFSEGHLAETFESSHLTAIVRRADVLLQEMGE